MKAEKQLVGVLLLALMLFVYAGTRPIVHEQPEQNRSQITGVLCGYMEGSRSIEVPVKNDLAVITSSMVPEVIKKNNKIPEGGDAEVRESISKKLGTEKLQLAGRFWKKSESENNRSQLS